MLNKPTDEMLGELLQSNSINEYMKENGKYLIDCDVTMFLNAYIKTKGLIKSQILKEAEMNEIYGYQIFSGSRNPSRDKLICLCIAMKMNLEEAQLALKIAGYASLYPKIKRDSIIILGFSNGKSVCEINNELYDNEENTL